MSQTDNIMRVSKTSPPQKLASAIANAAKNDPQTQVKLRAIGAGAVNQAVKALAIARGFVAVNGRDLSFRVGFDRTQGETQEISAIVFYVNLE